MLCYTYTRYCAMNRCRTDPTGPFLLGDKELNVLYRDLDKECSEFENPDDEDRSQSLILLRTKAFECVILSSYSFIYCFQ